MTAREVIEKLKLVPLPIEGGFFRETYKSTRTVESVLGKRSECTAIYYLITEDSFSALHVVDQDEIFHFYAGDPVEMFQIFPDGTSQKIIIGKEFSKNQVPQVVVPHGVWQGTKLASPGKDKWALLGCTVAPGFEYENFHLKSREELKKIFPGHGAEIDAYTQS